MFARVEQSLPNRSGFTSSFFRSGTICINDWKPELFLFDSFIAIYYQLFIENLLKFVTIILVLEIRWLFKIDLLVCSRW